MLPSRNVYYCWQGRTSTCTVESSLLSLVQHKLCMRPSDEDIQQTHRNPYLQLWNFGIISMQVIFEISCASIDPVTSLTLNSQVQSSPGGSIKEEIQSRAIVYIQLPGGKYHMVCLPFLHVFQTSHHHPQ